MTYAPAKFEAATSNGLGGDFVCLFDLILYVKVNNFSVILGRVFLGSKDRCVLLKDTTQ